MSESAAYWLLIAVLQSTIPLSPPLAMRLYGAALQLYRDDEDRARITGELAMGEVRHLREDLLLGSISGPGFEAALDTPQGSGRVRFVLTRQGLVEGGLSDGDEPAPAARRGSLPN